MLTRAQITHLRKLGDGQYRQLTGLFVAEGLKTVQELLHSPIETNAVYCTDEQASHRWLSIFGNKVHIVRERDMQQISQLRTPPGILAECKIPQTQPESIPNEEEFALALDGISDPGNMGTIIRTAEWFGVKQIFCSTDSADPWQPKVVQSAMGSLFRTRVIRTDLFSLLSQIKLRNGMIYGAVMEGKPLYEVPLKTAGSVLVIGSESHGIRPGLSVMINIPVTIPRASGSFTESLNAGVAAAILLSEFKRPEQKNA